MQKGSLHYKKMTEYEKLLERAASDGLHVVEDFHMESKSDGMIYGNSIALSSTIESQTKKRCVLAEEIEHFRLNTGDIIDMTSADNRKQELKARKAAVFSLINVNDLLNALKESANEYEVAECLDVTLEFLQEAVTVFRSRYGPWLEIDGCIISFDPLRLIMIDDEIVV